MTTPCAACRRPSDGTYCTLRDCPGYSAERVIADALCRSKVVWIEGDLETLAAEIASALTLRAPDVGRCGHEAPRLLGGAPSFCRLPHGHAGWHRGDDGSEWSAHSDATPPFDLDCQPAGNGEQTPGGAA